MSDFYNYFSLKIDHRNFELDVFFLKQVHFKDDFFFNAEYVMRLS